MIQFPFRRRRDSLVPGRYVLLLRLRPREVNRQKWNHYLPISRAWRGKCTFSAFLDENVCNSKRIDSLKWNQISSFYQPISSEIWPTFLLCYDDETRINGQLSEHSTLYLLSWRWLDERLGRKFHVNGFRHLDVSCNVTVSCNLRGPKRFTLEHVKTCRLKSFKFI